MLYNVRLYYNTGFDLENIPDSPALLDSCSYMDIQGHWDLQSLNITSLRLAITWPNIKDCDYLRFGTPGDSVNGCGYYIVVGRNQINLNMCIVTLELDALTTLGGAKNLNYFGGFTLRCHPADPRNDFNIASENISTDYPLVCKSLTLPSISMYKEHLVASTLDLTEYNVSDFNADGIPNDLKAMQFSAQVSGQSEGVIYIPKSPGLAKSTLFGILSQTTRYFSYNTSGYGLYRTKRGSGLSTNPITDIEQTKLNMSYIISLGLTGSLLFTYEPVILADPSTISVNPHVTTLFGGLNNFKCNLERTYNPKYRKVKFMLSKIMLVSAASGNSRELELTDIISADSDNEVYFTMASDPSPEGKVYLRPRFFLGAQTNSINQQGIAGAQWIKQPVSSNTSGLLIADNNYGMNVRSAATEYKYDNIIEGTQMAGDIVTGALRAGAEATAITNTFSGPLRAAAAASDAAFQAAVHAENIMKRDAMYALNYNKMKLENANARIQTPNLSCPVGHGLGNYMSGNEFIIYFVSPSNNDLARFDKYFDLYGYSQNIAFQKSQLTNKSNFNYIETNNVKIARQHGSIETRRQGEAQLNGGVRIWHNLPNNNWADGSEGD